jgi:hypothetical protein
MNNNDHVVHLGGLVGNFQSLEFLLRAALCKLPDALPSGIPFGHDIYLSTVGTELPESDITSFDSLGQLINKFNVVAIAQGVAQIDETLVTIRDALAHGRISAAGIDTPLRLLKFDRPRNGKVRVEFNEVMTEDWFIFQNRRVRDAIDVLLNYPNS